MNKCVVFDIDGTLFDTKSGIIEAINFVLDSYGLEPIAKENEDRFIGPPIKNSFENYYGLSESESNVAASKYREAYTKSFIVKTTEYLGMQSVLSEIRNHGWGVGIASMKTLPQINRLLSMFNCENLFSFVEGAREDGSYSKTQMLYNIKQNNPSYDEYIMVGDTRGDLMAARESGFSFVAADYGYGVINDIECIHIADIRDLVNVL